MKILILRLMMIAALLVPMSLGAQASALNCGSSSLTVQEQIECGNCTAGDCSVTPDKAAKHLTTTTNRIVNYLSAAVGAVAVIMIIIGGLRYVTSAGNDSGIQSAKNTITYAVVGLIIAALAQVVTKFVLNNL